MNAEKNIIVLALKKDFWNKSKNILTRDMFPDQLAMLFDTIKTAHSVYEGDIQTSELMGLVNEHYPAMPDGSKETLKELVSDLVYMPEPNPAIGLDLAAGIWRRNKARVIGEYAVDIYVGDSKDFGEIKRLLEQVSQEDITLGADTFTEVTASLEEMVESSVTPAEFLFTLPLLHANISGMDRGCLGIVFARPEVGKTTFCCWMVAEYLRQGFSVAFFANEEPAIRIKNRVVTAYLEKDDEEIRGDMANCKQVWGGVSDNLRVFDAVAVDVGEINNYCELNKPDILIIDQLDKVRIDGKFNREDERLKDVYVQAREIAKRNNCLVWAVSQANYDAHRASAERLDYSMLDNSRTGKAGEGDFILAISKPSRTATREEDPQGYVARNLTISKNKLNGWHGVVPCTIDEEKGRYEA